MAAGLLHDQPQVPHNKLDAKTVSSPGPRCLKCADKCPGLDLHYWRKVCRHCRCAREDHDLEETDEKDHQPITLLFDTLPRHGNPQQLLSRLEKLNLDDPVTQARMCSSDNDIVITRIITENLRSQKYIAMLPKDKQLFAAQLRRRQLQRQLPLHDLHSRFCDSLTQKELHKFQKFSDKRKNKASGVGQVGEIPSSGNFECHRCKQVMAAVDIAVFTSRMGQDTSFHPGCFTCATCKELLVDMIYFFRNGDIYCERHYADLIYPRCAACDEIILAHEYTQAESQTWHVQHFCCWYCDAQLAGQRYIAKHGNPYCIGCFDRLYSKICSTCGKTITADSPGLTHGDFHWHACPHCFSCHCCGRNLINQQFLLKDGKLFCSLECKQVFQDEPHKLFPRHLHP